MIKTKFKFIGILLIMILSCSLMSCKKIYKENEARAFIDEIYEYIDSNKGNYGLIDVRPLDESYALGHFKGFINYDIEEGTINEFIYKIESLYTKEKALFLIDEDGSKVIALKDVLKEHGYKKVYIFLGGYEKLALENQNDFIVVTGKEDCGC